MTRTALDARNRRRQREPTRPDDTQDAPEAHSRGCRHGVFALVWIDSRSRRDARREPRSGCGGHPSLSLFNKTITDNDQNPLEQSFAPFHAAPVNIPPEVARSQGKHGIKGAVHGIKGGRPRLDLTEAQRAERRRAQQEAYRRRQGIPPKPKSRNPRTTVNWAQKYFDIWGKPPGAALTPEEFAEREPLWIRWCAEWWG